MPIWEAKEPVSPPMETAPTLIPKKLILLGAGGNSLDILDAVEQINRELGRTVFDCVGLLDNDPERWGKPIGHTHVLGPLAEAAKIEDVLFINAIGSPDSFFRRAEITRACGIDPSRFATILHPSATISDTARIGPGSVVLQNVCVGSNARVGSHVIVLSNTIISHGVEVGDFSCVAAGVCLAGNVRVGASSYMGANVSVRGGVTIGEQCLAGMGAVILRDVPPNSVVVGNPARFLRPTLPASRVQRKRKKPA